MQIALPSENYRFGQYIPAQVIDSDVFDSFLVRPYTIGQLHSIAKARDGKNFNFYDAVNLVRKNIKVTKNGVQVPLEDIELINMKLAFLNIILTTDHDFKWIYNGYCDNCAKEAKKSDKIESKRLGRDVTEEESVYHKYTLDGSRFTFTPMNYAVNSIDKFDSEYIIQLDEMPDLSLTFKPMTVGRQYVLDNLVNGLEDDKLKDFGKMDYLVAHARTCLEMTDETFEHPYIQELAEEHGITAENKNSLEFKQEVIQAMPRSFVSDYNDLILKIDPSFDQVKIACMICGEEQDFYPPSSLKELLPYI